MHLSNQDGQELLRMVTVYGAPEILRIVGNIIANEHPNGDDYRSQIWKVARDLSNDQEVNV